MSNWIELIELHTLLYLRIEALSYLPCRPLSTNIHKERCNTIIITRSTGSTAMLPISYPDIWIPFFVALCFSGWTYTRIRILLNIFPLLSWNLGRISVNLLYHYVCGLSAILTHWITGILRDATGNYHQSFLINVLMAIGSIILISFVRKKKLFQNPI